MLMSLLWMYQINWIPTQWILWMHTLSVDDYFVNVILYNYTCAFNSSGWFFYRYHLHYFVEYCMHVSGFQRYDY